MTKQKSHAIGRPPVKNKRITVSVRLDPQLLDEIKAIENLTMTQAVENGLKLVLAYRTLNIIKIN